MATTSFPRLSPGAKSHFPLSSGSHELWHKSVPSSISRALEWGDDSAGWNAWRDYLRNRVRPRLPGKVLGDSRAMLWTWSDRTPASPAGLLSRIEKLLNAKSAKAELAEELRYWLADSSAQPGTGRAIDSLCWAWNLPRLAKRLPATLWWTLLNRLVETCYNAEQPGPDDDAVAQQILAGELPLTLAYLLPELKACRALAVPARRLLSSGILQLLDDKGFPQGIYWPQFGVLLATWTRSRLLGQELRRGSWDDAAQARFGEMILQALRAATPEGGVALNPPGREAWSASFWSSALGAANNPAARKLAFSVLPARLVRESDAAPVKNSDAPDAADQSDATSLAVMRTAWRGRADLLTVNYADSAVRMELIADRDRLWSGVWDLDLQLAGETLVPTTPWESICWVSDEDVVYFEIERGFSSGVRIQRQMLLARQDRFLLLADSVLNRKQTTVSYRSAVPLNGVLTTEPAAETREIRLRGSRATALAIPCALNEWRQGHAHGKLEVREQSLVLEQSVPGGNLFAPLFFDLDPRREGAPNTWRSLTVAAQREILPADVAVGYRVRIGKRQWLVYRAMGERAGRTCLGANTWSQFLAMRVKKSGSLETLLEIE